MHASRPAPPLRLALLAAVLALVASTAAAGAPGPAGAATPLAPATTRAAAPFVLYADAVWFLQADSAVSCTVLGQDAATAAARLRDTRAAVFATPSPYPPLYATALRSLRADWPSLQATVAWAARMASTCPRSQLARISRSASDAALLTLRRQGLVLALLTAYPTGDTAAIRRDAKTASAWRQALLANATGSRAGATSADFVRRPDWWLKPLAASIATGNWNMSSWDAEIVSWNRAWNALDRDAARDLPLPW